MVIINNNVYIKQKRYLKMKLIRLSKPLNRPLTYISLSMLALFGSVAPAQAVQTQTQPKITQIAIWGDSMTMVWGQRLQELTGIPVAKNGVGGETIQQIKARFDTWTQPNTLHILWGGHNNFNSRNNNGSTVEPTIAKMVATKPAGLFWVLSLTNDPDHGISSIKNPPLRSPTYYSDVINGLNPRMAQKYGSSYVDIRGYLISNGLADVKLSPTSEDKANISNDVPPASLRADRGNPGHINDYGRSVVAGRLNTLIRQSGLLTGTAPSPTPTPTPAPNPDPTPVPTPNEEKPTLFTMLRTLMKRLFG